MAEATARFHFGMLAPWRLRRLTTIIFLRDR
jgi:hypothetical protein